MHWSTSPLLRMMITRLPVWLCLAMSLAPTAMAAAGETGRERLANVQSWLCYYGDERKVLEVPGTDLLVLDADSLGQLASGEKKGRICLAYISLGEAEESRWYWPQIKTEPWVLSANPDWPGARLVDVRSPAWRDLLVKHVAPKLLQAGYDGLMLDTLDSVDTLVATDPLAFEGVASAMVSLIKDLRVAFPGAILLGNGGFGVLAGSAPALDGVMIESVRATYDFAIPGYRERRADELAIIDRRLAKARKLGLPTFALDYVEPTAPAALREKLIATLRAAGCRPYLSQIDLHGLPPAAAK